MTPYGQNQPSFAPHLRAEHYVFLTSLYFKKCPIIEGITALSFIFKDACMPVYKKYILPHLKIKHIHNTMLNNCIFQTFG